MLTKLASYQFTVPKGGDKVYKDECVYCFDNPTSDGGIYVCLSSLLAVSSRYVKLHVEKTKKYVFLNLQKVPKKIIKTDDSPPEKKITKLAIGVEGGFDVNQDKIEYDDINSLVVTDDHGNEIKRYPLPNPNLPLNAQLSIAAVLSHEGANLQSDIQAWEEKRVVSKHAENLQQLNNGVKIAPNGWKCSLCDLTQNLWLNLTDGTILCGRRYYDGTGGNNHAVEYYQQTNYPLAVKLGTITADGGDVYSYDEDDMVEDPKLKEHLQHFGINISQLEKTDKTMTELEIEANLSIKAEWDLIQEAGKKLVPLFGPGYTGMINLGNTCYMNSLMQVLFSMQEFQKQYGDKAVEIFQSSTREPPLDFKTQMAKLALGLTSGNYSKQPADDNPQSLGVRPQMLKDLIGRGHVEFSTNHQQDVQEYFLHVMDFIEKDEKSLETKLKDSFSFQLEDRIQCCSSNKVSYKKKEDLLLQLPIPLDAATNRDEYEEFLRRRKEAEEKNESISSQSVVRLNIPLSACIEAFSSTETIDDYYSTAVKQKTNALKQTRFGTFPDYLVIQLRKFTINKDWTPAKLDVSVDMTDELDLSHLRSSGLQANEELLPEDDEESESSEPQFNEEFVNQLMDMGFPLEACKKAVHFTNNQGVEAAMNWVFDHSQDDDFALPLQVASKTKKVDDVDPSSVAMIVSMGFSEARAKTALRKTQNNVEAAAEWIFTHMDEPEEMDTTPAKETAIPCKDGPGKYRLFAFISHMGTSTSCGHYVCHIMKEGRWVIFNDRKVALSEVPPKDLGYLYFYKRISEQDG